MNRVRLFLSMAFATVLSTSKPLWAQLAQPEASAADTPSQTRELFRKGLAAYNAGQIEEAHHLFLQAWSIQPSADVAMQLAQTEIDLGKYADAAEHLDFALRNFTPSINDKMRSLAKQAFSDVVRHVAKMSITVNQAGAEILINGRIVGKAPLTHSVYADTGNCVVEARFEGASATKSLLVEPGKDASVELTLTPLAPSQAQANPAPVAPIPPPVQPAPTPVNHSQPSIVPVIVGGAVAIVGIGTGVGLRLASNSEDDHAKSLLARLGAGHCAGAAASSPDCQTLMDSLKKTDRERNGSTVGFLVGGAALVGTALYWFWPREDSKSSAKAWHINGTIGNGNGRLLLEGEF